MITVGDIVRFKEFLEAGDESSRFEVVEDNGDRLMIRFICDLPIAPVQVIRREELCKA